MRGKCRRKKEGAVVSTGKPEIGDRSRDMIYNLYNNIRTRLIMLNIHHIILDLVVD